MRAFGIGVYKSVNRAMCARSPRSSCAMMRGTHNAALRGYMRKMNAFLSGRLGLIGCAVYWVYSIY